MKNAKMTKEQALGTLKRGLDVAVERGAYTVMEDIVVLHHSFHILREELGIPLPEPTKEEEPENATPVLEKDVKK